MAARRLPGARRLRSRCALAASTLPCAWAFAPSAWPSPAVRVLGRVPVEPASCFGFCLPQRGLTPPAAAPLPDTLVSGSFRAFGFTAGPLATLVRAGPRPCVEDFSLSLSLFLFLSFSISLSVSLLLFPLGARLRSLRPRPKAAASFAGAVCQRAGAVALLQVASLGFYFVITFVELALLGPP